jgi:hypothetical protein
MSFLDFCRDLEAQDEQKVSVDNTSVITFTNKNKKAFSIKTSVAIDFIKFLEVSSGAVQAAWSGIDSRKSSFIQYEEKSYRAIFDATLGTRGLDTISSLSGSQTRQLTAVITKLICYLGKFDFEGIEVNSRFDLNSVRMALTATTETQESLDQTGVEEIRVNLEAQFKQWMIDTGLSENTADKYSKGTGSFVNKLVKPDLVGFSGLFSISAVSELDKLNEFLKKNHEWQESNRTGNRMYEAGIGKYRSFLITLSQLSALPKPFLLLAGISGTGKTQFVRQQAAATRPDLSNYQLIAVRPDWHEPSDLLGYVTRIKDERYVPTPFLKFLISAWCDAFERVDTDKIVLRPLDEITTFWACLDEMNLAPVEQYFADYLAVLETRKWDGGSYTCDALVHPARLLEKDTSLPELQKSLGLEGKDELWTHFLKRGIPLPPNLIVAGTVNMDETTHGFSRKVIDRAFTIDFGEFFPNDFDKFFAPDRKPKSLKFSRYSNASQADLASVTADVNGDRSVEFLKAINEPLRGTPFELAFRAMNELLLAVKCFAPADEETLEAVWDDFLMTKLLPRIEGDAEKLRADGEKSLLTGLLDKVAQLLPKTVATGTRPDLLQTDTSGGAVQVPLRSLKKIKWMQERLTNNAFTSFWP